MNETPIPKDAVRRPWGWFVATMTMPGYKTKTLVVYPKQRLSLQSHQYRKETWSVVRGEGICTVDRNLIKVREDALVSVPMGAVHRIENTSPTENLIISEVQIGEKCEEDDIIRYDDDYGRINKE